MKTISGRTKHTIWVTNRNSEVIPSSVIVRRQLTKNQKQNMVPMEESQNNKSESTVVEKMKT